MGWKPDVERTDKHQSVLSRRLTSRHVETEKLYQEERWRRRWPVGRFRVYLETSDNRVTGRSDVGYERKLEVTPELWALVAFTQGKKVTEKEFWCILVQMLLRNVPFVPSG